jgi:regulator of replication initiation timing
MPSTLEFLGQKLEESKELLEDLVNKNAALRIKNSKLKKRVQSLKAVLKGTASENLRPKNKLSVS